MILLSSIALGFAEKQSENNSSMLGRSKFSRISFGKFPGGELTSKIDLLARVIQNAAGTSSSSTDVAALKSNLLTSGNNPKLFLLSISSLPPTFLARLAALCRQLSIDCVALMPEQLAASEKPFDGVTLLIAREENNLIKSLVPLGDPDIAQASTVLLVFSPSGNLLWLGDSSDINILQECEIILRITRLMMHEHAPVSPEARKPPMCPEFRTDDPSNIKSLSIEDLRQTVYALNDGSSATLAEAWRLTQRGPYVLIFWATWCAPCVAELPILQELAQRFDNQATFVGLVFHENTPQERLKTQQLLVEKGATYSQYVVNDQRIIRQLQQLPPSANGSYPFFAIFDNKGSLREVIKGALHEKNNRDKFITTLEEIGD